MGDENHQFSSVRRGQAGNRTSALLGSVLATVLGGGSLLGLLSCTQDQSGPRCPEPPQQFARDFIVKTQARAAALSRLGMGELRNETEVAAKSLFEGLPNADRVAVAQMLMSQFCQIIVNSSLPEKEKLDRVREFNTQIIQFIGDKPTPAPPRRPAPESRNTGAPAAKALRVDKYLDRNAVRVAGERNVTIHMLAHAGHDTDRIEGAAQRALRSRGYNIVPLFRRSFAQDGLHDELFRGSASLAREFQLDRYCDSILLGTIRVGSPERSLGTLFIGEAVLNLRVISPATGAVLDELEVPAEGGGPDAETSAANTLLKLQQEVEKQLSEWSWSPSA